MTPRLETVEEIFHAALDRSPDELSAFLDKSCAGDEVLRGKVEELLAAHRQAGSFIETPIAVLASSIVEDGQTDLLIGETIGHYKISRRISAGGMGAVYLAGRSDQQYEKQVAIKLIKRGMDTDSVLRHFRNERQILASFDHPNIARLLDGGATEDGLPYFVMEYVEGLPIDQYCEKRALSITDRLKLFREVCGAVIYAHRHAVIHRDIKPSNILVTSDGTPKLLDFGIAKILQPRAGADPLVTITGARLMTPEYASPEQVRGQPVTTATDVYSLGVVLYQLLTGHKPYRLKTRTPEEISRAIIEQEPPRPSTAIARGDGSSKSQIANPKLLRGDLDNIVLMALRKEPERRYQSVEQFSEDIRRHLEALPVVARKDTLAYRGAKFVRRNAVTTAAAAFVFLTLLGGIIATTSQAHRAKAEKARAERRFNDVRQLARSVLFDYHDAIKDLPGATRVRERLVKDALTYLDSLASEAAGDPALQRELAAAYQRVGDVRGQAFSASLGDRAGAMESYLKSLRIHEALVAATPRDAQNRRDLADIHRKIGNALLETSEAARGLEYLRTSLEIYSKLAVERSANPDARADLADIYNDIGSALEDRGDMAGTLEHHRKAMPLREALVASQPSNAKARRDLSVTYVNTGRALYFNGDTAGAMEINRKALDLRTALNSEDPTNADYRRLLAIAYQNDGDYRAHSGDIAGALESFRKKIVLDRESLATDPANAQARLDFAYSSERMGVLLSQLGQNSEAVSHFRDNLSSQEKTVAADPQNLSARYKLVLARAEVAETEAKLGKRDFALAGCREAVALLNEASDDPTNAYIRGLRGRIYSYLGSAYAALANAHLTTAEERRDDWRNARVMYERSLTVWNDLRSRALLLADDATKPEELSREIAKCDAALGR